jgi:hypothetical protein
MQTWPVRHALKPPQAARRASRMRAFFLGSVETEKIFLKAWNKARLPTFTCGQAQQK